MLTTPISSSFPSPLIATSPIRVEPEIVLDPVQSEKIRNELAPLHLVLFGFPISLNLRDFFISVCVELQREGIQMSEFLFTGSRLRRILLNQELGEVDTDFTVPLTGNCRESNKGVIKQIVLTQLQHKLKIFRRGNLFYCNGHRLAPALSSATIFESYNLLENLVLADKFFLITLKGDRKIDLSFTWNTPVQCFNSSNSFKCDLLPELFDMQNAEKKLSVRSSGRFHPEQALDLARRGLMEIDPAETSQLFNGLRGHAKSLSQGFAPIDYSDEAGYVRRWASDFPPSRFYEFFEQLERFLASSGYGFVQKLIYLFNLRTILSAHSNFWSQNWDAFDAKAEQIFQFKIPFSFLRGVLFWWMARGSPFREAGGKSHPPRFRLAAGQNIHLIAPIPWKETASLLALTDEEWQEQWKRMPDEGFISAAEFQRCLLDALTRAAGERRALLYRRLAESSLEPIELAELLTDLLFELSEEEIISFSHSNRLPQPSRNLLRLWIEHSSLEKSRAIGFIKTVLLLQLKSADASLFLNIWEFSLARYPDFQARGEELLSFLRSGIPFLFFLEGFVKLLRLPPHPPTLLRLLESIDPRWFDHPRGIRSGWKIWQQLTHSSDPQKPSDINLLKILFSRPLSLRALYLELFEISLNDPPSTRAALFKAAAAFIRLAHPGANLDELAEAAKESLPSFLLRIAQESAPLRIEETLFQRTLEAEERAAATLLFPLLEIGKLSDKTWLLLLNQNRFFFLSPHQRWACLQYLFQNNPLSIDLDLIALLEGLLPEPDRRKTVADFVQRKKYFTAAVLQNLVASGWLQAEELIHLDPLSQDVCNLIDSGQFFSFSEKTQLELLDNAFQKVSPKKQAALQQRLFIPKMKSVIQGKQIPSFYPFLKKAAPRPCLELTSLLELSLLAPEEAWSLAPIEGNGTSELYELTHRCLSEKGQPIASIEQFWLQRIKRISLERLFSLKRLPYVTDFFMEKIEHAVTSQIKNCNQRRVISDLLAQNNEYSFEQTRTLIFKAAELNLGAPIFSFLQRQRPLFSKFSLLQIARIYALLTDLKLSTSDQESLAQLLQDFATELQKPHLPLYQRLLAFEEINRSSIPLSCRKNFLLEMCESFVSSKEIDSLSLYEAWRAYNPFFQSFFINLSQKQHLIEKCIAKIQNGADLESFLRFLCQQNASLDPQVYRVSIDTLFARFVQQAASELLPLNQFWESCRLFFLNNGLLLSEDTKKKSRQLLQTILDQCPDLESCLSVFAEARRLMEFSSSENWNVFRSLAARFDSPFYKDRTSLRIFRELIDSLSQEIRIRGSSIVSANVVSTTFFISDTVKEASVLYADACHSFMKEGQFMPSNTIKIVHYILQMGERMDIARPLLTTYLTNLGQKPLSPEETKFTWSADLAAIYKELLLQSGSFSDSILYIQILDKIIRRLEFRSKVELFLLMQQKIFQVALLFNGADLPNDVWINTIQSIHSAFMNFHPWLYEHTKNPEQLQKLKPFILISDETQTEPLAPNYPLHLTCSLILHAQTLQTAIMSKAIRQTPNSEDSLELELLAQDDRTQQLETNMLELLHFIAARDLLFEAGHLDKLNHAVIWILQSEKQAIPLFESLCKIHEQSQPDLPDRKNILLFFMEKLLKNPTFNHSLFLLNALKLQPQLIDLEEIGWLIVELLDFYVNPQKMPDLEKASICLPLLAAFFSKNKNPVEQSRVAHELKRFNVLSKYRALAIKMQGLKIADFGDVPIIENLLQNIKEI